MGKLRAHASKDVADLAKEIVKKWKTEVEKAKAGSSSSKPGINGKVQCTSLASFCVITTDRKSNTCCNSTKSVNDADTSHAN